MFLFRSQVAFAGRSVRRWVRGARRISVQRGVAGLLLGALLLTGLGLPVPIAARKAGQTPFPCQAKACGCANAERCWRSCCCHTNAEKLAWAKKHGVTPPDFFLAMIAAPSKKAVVAKSCCAVRKEARQESCDLDVESLDDPTGVRSWKWVVAIDAQRCSGITPLWLVLNQTLPVAGPLWSIASVPTQEKILLSSIWAESFVDDLDAPPPRRAVVAVFFVA